MNGRRAIRPAIALGFVLASRCGRARSALAEDTLIQNMDAADQQAAPPSPAPPPAHGPLIPVKERGKSDNQEFIPLLAPLAQRKSASSRAENVHHGWVRLRELYQHVNNGTADASSRLESGGSVERLYGNPLSLVWNGNLTYRNGNSFTAADDYRHPRLRMFQLALAQKQQDGGVGRLGRFIPTELPGLGFLDGAQLERHPTEDLHVGAMIGARPERRELGLSTRELMTAGYGSYQHGEPGESFYSGTLGFFQTTFGGVRDEEAMLYDQHSDFGPKLNAYLSSQVNFNSGAARVHTQGIRLTRLDFYTTSPLTPVFLLRSGVSHFERPDTAAERDLSGGDLGTFDRGYWRYWTGSAQSLPWQMRLDEEVALIQAPGQSDQGQVRGTISRYGLFQMNQALMSFTAYSLNRVDGNGAGGILSLIFPLLDNRLNVIANSGLRYSGQQGQKKSLNPNDASLYLSWFISKGWEADFGVAQTYQDYIQSTLIDSSLNYRW